MDKSEDVAHTRLGVEAEVLQEHEQNGLIDSE